MAAGRGQTASDGQDHLGAAHSLVGCLGQSLAKTQLGGGGTERAGTKSCSQ